MPRVLARANALSRRARPISGIGSRIFARPISSRSGHKALRDGHHGYTAATGIPPVARGGSANLHQRFGVTVSLTK